MGRIRLAIGVISKVRNFPIYFMDYFGLLKSKLTKYELRNGVKYWLRSSSCDRGILTEILVLNDYTPPGFEIGEKDIVLDVGAQAGVFSIYAASKAPRGMVYSVEPTPDNFKLLEMNISENNFKNIKTEKCVLAAKSGTESLLLVDSNTGGHTITSELKQSAEALSKGKSIPVKALSLDDFMKKHRIDRIDFLKIDCEGAEYDILFNGSDANLSKIKKISLEYHNLGKGKDYVSMKDFLEKKGFKLKHGMHNPKGGLLYARRD